MRRFDLLDVLKVVRYPLFFLVVFVVFLVLLFPTERFIPLLESQLGDALGRKVLIGDLSISVFGGIDLEEVQIEIPQDPKAAGPAMESDEEDAADEEEGDEQANTEKAAAAKPKRPLFYTIDEIEIDVGLLSLMFGELAVDVNLDIFGGEVNLSYEGPLPGQKEDKPDKSKLKAVSAESKKADDKPPTTPVRIRAEVEEISLALIHELRDKLPIPAMGQVSLAADLRSTTGKMTDLNGELGLVLENVVLGKAGGSIEVGGMPLSLDPVAISGLELAVEVDDGLAEFSEFVTRSQDVDLKVEGAFTFAEPMSRSRFDFYLMFNILEGYTQKSDVARLLVTNLEQFSRDLKRAKRDDGYYGFRYRGMVRNWKGARLLAAKTYRKRGERKERKLQTPDRSARRKASRAKARARPGGFPIGSGGDDSGSAEGARVPLGSPMDRSPQRRRPPADRQEERPEKQAIDKPEVAAPAKEVVESEMEFEEEEVVEEGGEEGSVEEEESGDEGEGASGDEEIEIEE